MSQVKEQNKTTEKKKTPKLNGVLPDIEFKTLGIRMLN